MYFFKLEWQHIIHLVHCPPQKGNSEFNLFFPIDHILCGRRSRILSCVIVLLLSPTQTSMPGHGTSKQKNAPWGLTLRLLTAAGMTNPRTLNFHLWITACRVCWGRGWIYLRISTIHMSSGWRERCFPSPSVGRSCSRVTELLEKKTSDRWGLAPINGALPILPTRPLFLALRVLVQGKAGLAQDIQCSAGPFWGLWAWR